MNDRLRSYWQGKRILITGASSGLGWAITEALAPFGVTFCLLSRRNDKMLELAAKLKDLGSTFWTRSCDIRDRQQVYASVQDFHRKHGAVDVAWINSGVSLDSSFSGWDWDSFETSVDTNLKGAIYTIQACLEIMVPEGRGAVVGIGSAAAMRGLPARGVYSLTKVSLDYFLQSKAVELPELQFTIIHPGFVDTPINADNPNRFWLLKPEQAAQIMIKAVAHRKRWVVYPFRMHLLFRVVRLFPLRLYYRLGRKLLQVSRPGRAD